MGQGIVIAAVALAAVWFVDNRTQPMPGEAEQATRAIAETPAAEPEPARPQSASVVSIPRSQGQFFTQGRVNRGSVRFLVDTGASAVALTSEDARRAGIDPRDLTYNVPVDTANGRTYAARVIVDEIRIGGIVVRDVQSLVVEDGLHISLLGMTFLGELQKVEATPNQLILRL